LRGPNASAAPFAIPTANAARPRARSTPPLFSTSSHQYGLECYQNTSTYPSTSQAGLGHRHPRHPDHRQAYIQEWPLEVVERPVARSALLRSHHPRDLVLAQVLSERGINVGPNNYSQPHTCVVTLMPGSRCRGILRGGLLVLTPTILICDPRTSSVVEIWCNCRINPIGHISSETSPKRCSLSVSPPHTAPMSVI